MKPVDVLEVCLRDLAVGRRTLAECIAAHPELAGELRAAALLQTWTPPTLRPEASRQIEARLRAAVRRSRPARSAAATPLVLLRWALAASLVLGFALGGAGVVAASGNSLPGEALYPVKRANEAAQLFFTPPSERATFHTLLAQRRLNEITRLSQRGVVNEALLNDLSVETEAALAAVTNVAPGEQAEVVSLLLAVTQNQQAVLQAVMAVAPPQAQAGLERAIQASSQHYQDAQGHVGGTPPPEASHLPPGQGRKTKTPLPTSTHRPPGQGKKTATPLPTSTHRPPGQGKKTATPLPESTQLPPEQERKTETPLPEATQLPPVQEKTETPLPEATQLPPGQEKKTETPLPEATLTPAPAEATPCPTNPAGRPACGP